jgi:hypothetical protein
MNYIASAGFEVVIQRPDDTSISPAPHVSLLDLNFEPEDGGAMFF